MAKPVKPESFEVTEYTKGHEDITKMFSVIKEITSDTGWAAENLVNKANAAAAVRCSFHGDLLKVFYQTCEQNLPTRMRMVSELADDAVSAFVKELKKEYRTRTGQSLKLKEQKDRANYSVQKVSLNERYYYTCWKFYELE